MYKVSSFLFILIVFSSCSNHENLLYIDSYYNKLYNLDRGVHNYNTIIYDKHNVNMDLFDKYNSVAVSPLVYNDLKDFWGSYTKNLFILEGSASDLPPNQRNVFVDDTHAYTQLLGSLVSDKRTKELKEVGIIADYYSSNDKIKIDSFLSSLSKNYNVVLCSLDKNSSINKLKKFIKDNESIELWVIDSKTRSLSAFDLLGENNLIIIKDGAILKDLNHNIIYSIDLHLNELIDSVFKHNLDIIYSVLKKY